MLVPESKYTGRQTQSEPELEPEPETSTESSPRYECGQTVQCPDAALCATSPYKYTELSHTHTHRTRRQTDRVSVRERGRVWVSETAFHQR